MTKKIQIMFYNWCVNRILVFLKRGYFFFILGISLTDLPNFLGIAPLQQFPCTATSIALHQHRTSKSNRNNDSHYKPDKGDSPAKC